ncbi:MAG: HU family DNA-binding protein [Candidatus Parcubacteria bacterium]|nr:HU family DNA-binding protein [Candidatus Parcubacteria bacterium]
MLKTNLTTHMNKAALIEAVASKTNLTKKQIEEILDTILTVMTDTLKNKEEVVLTGFGTFSAKIRHARKGVNPQRPTEKIDIPEVVIPKFKSGKALKDALKGK